MIRFERETYEYVYMYACTQIHIDIHVDTPALLLLRSLSILYIFSLAWHRICTLGHSGETDSPLPVCFVSSKAHI